MTADHSAPVIYKLTGSPPSFSPNGDGMRDSIRLYYGFWDSVSGSGQVRVQVVNSSGKVVRDFGARTASNGLASIAWDGKGPGGAALPAGRYTLRANAVDEVGLWAATAEKSIRIDRARPIVKKPLVNEAARRITSREWDISTPLTVELRVYNSAKSVVWRSIRTHQPNGYLSWTAPHAAFAALKSGGRMRVLVYDAAQNQRVGYYSY